MAKKSPPIAKITRPTLPRVFPRERLFKLIDQGRECSVIWISGPPGSGKTTLVSSYLDFRKLSSLWYQVDECDADHATFFYYMGLAARKAAPRYKRPLPLFTPEYGLGVPTFTRRYFENLGSRLNSPSILVFDNYQEIPFDSSFHEIIRTGLSALPANITAVIISRSEPPAAFASMHAENKLRVIGWNDLRLAPEESRGIAELREVGTTQSKLYEWLHEKTDGWAAGLVLLAERAKTENVETVLRGGLTLKEIFNYFAGVIFDKTDSETRVFLEKTSVFRKFTPDMAEELARNPRAAGVLSDLNRRNYFTQRHVAQAPVYQYHNLFREFLLERAQEAFPSDELLRVRHHAARLCEEAGQSEDAVELYLEGGAWDDAAKLILRQAPAMIAQGRGRTLADWIGTVPEATVRSIPYLLYWRGICHLPFAPPQGREYLDKAFRLFEAGRDAEGVFFAWSAMVNSYLSEWDDFTPLDPWIDWLDKRLSDGSTPPPAVHAHVAVSMIWALTYRRPWHPDVRTWAGRAMSLSKNHPDPNLRVQACIAVSTYNYFMGEEAQGMLPATEGKRIARGAGLSPLTLLGMKFIEIILHWVSAAPGSSSHLIAESLAIAEKTGVHIYDSMLYSYAVCDFLTKGDLADAGELLGKMESMIGGNQRCALGHYHYVVAWYYFLLNDLPNAAVHAERGVQIPFETGMPFGEATSRILLAFVCQERGEPGKALEQIDLAREIGRKTRSSLFEWLCGLADAWVALNNGQEKSGLESLKKALTVGRAKGFMNCEGWLPSVMTRLCLKALEKGIEAEYVRDLIRKRGLIPDTPTYECEDWPWRVKIFTLGGFKMLVDDKTAQFSGKVQKKPLEMLKAVIAFGGTDVREEQLIDALWPEADCDAARTALKTTIYRLRQLIGNQNAVTVQDGRVSLDRRYCWVDAWAFEQMLENAETGMRSADFKENKKGNQHKESGINLLEKAIRLYRGHFLADDGNPWTASPQEWLKNMFLRALNLLGNHWERTGKFLKAIECYRKGLEVDDLSEELYQRLMLCYQKLGRKADAVKTYRRCRDMLKANLGVEPSQVTEEIYRGLMGVGFLDGK